MPAETHVKFTVGDRCIIHVNTSNHPPGWWFGIVDAVEPCESYDRVRAHITGAFEFDEYARPVYGDRNVDVGSSFSIYQDSANIRGLVRWLLRDIAKLEDANDKLRTRLDELRTLFTQAVSPERVEEALRRLRAEVRKP